MSYLSLYICVKQKAMFLDRIKNEQQKLQAVNMAYNELHQKHTELSSQAKGQTQLICDLEVKTQTHMYSSINTGVSCVSPKQSYGYILAFYLTTLQFWGFFSKHKCKHSSDSQQK